MFLFFVDYVIAFLITMFDNKKNKKVILLLFILFVILFAFRDISMTESDIDAYRYFYENYHSKNLTWRFAFEPGYDFANKIFVYSGLPFECFMICLGVFYSLLFWRASLKYTARPGVALIPALFFMFYYATGALRQSVAQIIAYYAFHFLISENETENFVLRIGKRRLAVKNKALLKYYILSLVAFSFHRTAIILFVIPFFIKRTYKILITGGIILLNVFLPYAESILIKIPYIYGKYRAYKIDNDTGFTVAAFGGIFSFRLLEYVIIIIILLLIKEKSKVEKLALSLAELGVLIQVFLSYYIGATYRLLQYTDAFLVLFVISFYERLQKQAYRYIFVLIVSGCVFLRFYRLFSANEDLNISYGLIGLG